MRKQTERLLNLLIALRSARGWIDRDSLRAALDDYRAQPDNAAFDRMFSRDKDLLRRLGIEISTTDWSDADTGETAYGYRITEGDYALPPIVLTPEEAGVLSVAQTVFEGSELAADTARAVTKLRGLGLDIGGGADREVPPARMASGLFATFVAALGDRRPVEFDYRRPGDRLHRRRFEPYALLTRGDRVYAVGRDIDRDAVRTFRLSRIAGPVRPLRSRAAGDYAIPTDFRAEDYFAPERAPEGARTALLALEPGRADPLRREGRALGAAAAAAQDAGAPAPGAGREDWEGLELDFDDAESLTARLLGFAPGVEPLAPAALRTAYAARLRETAAALAAIAAPQGADRG
ncbi:WYL domain-containing protein [Brevibacterium sp. BRM-1]|uniref:helix-turn-helix transcriptional regulator n=1 Tax=Brevibacterium sp. BRM-1 TaxID=2999062 RepID=UPI002280E9F6|nr:WYL domain-containing protein [Brevibacterium sp. BRM-1]WAL40775.1 WYL domain-containing protein [Brevibacterium sp. BRM-1]